MFHSLDVIEKILASSSAWAEYLSPHLKCFHFQFSITIETFRWKIIKRWCCRRSPLLPFPGLWIAINASIPLYKPTYTRASAVSCDLHRCLPPEPRGRRQWRTQSPQPTKSVGLQAGPTLPRRLESVRVSNTLAYIFIIYLYLKIPPGSAAVCRPKRIATLVEWKM